MRTDIIERKEEILSWIEEELTLYEIKTRLGCKYETLQHYLKKMGIEYKGQQARKGQYKGNRRFETIEEYIAKAKCIKSHVLKQKLISFGVKEARCELCGLDTWNSRPIPLELHHQNGDHYDNELTNLQILCPNCHAQQGNNSGSAIGRYTTHEFERKKKLKAEKAELAKKAEAEREAKLALGIRPDSLGRVSYNTLSENTWLERKDLIINSGVDLTKFGWKTELQKVTGLTRRQVDLTINHFYNDFKDIIYIRN